MSATQVIVNPISGRGRGEQSIPAIRSTLDSLGLDYELTRTERPWHAAELAEQAARQGCSTVLAAGGDGTANEILNGLMQARAAGVRPLPAVGVLSVGRGNDFAFGMRFPADLEAACRLAAGGARRAIDVGHVRGGLYPQGRYFGNGVGIGFDAVVGFEALKMTRLHGFASYIVAALKTIFLFPRGPQVRIEIDQETLALPALMVSIMNGRRMGGGFMMAPEAETGDGLFDVCIARQVSQAGIVALIPRFMAGTQAGHPAVRFHRARRIRVVAEQGVLPAHADGETLCTEGRELEIEVVPGALEVLTAEAAS